MSINSSITALSSNTVQVLSCFGAIIYVFKKFLKNSKRSFTVAGVNKTLRLYLNCAFSGF